MDETLLRLVVVLTGTLVVVAVSAVLKTRARRPSRAVTDSGLAQGIYLLSSGNCGECVAARARLDRAVGPDHYTEITWEAEPGEFDRLRIAEVPSTLVVAEDGSAVWHSGVPSGIAKLGNP